MNLALPAAVAGAADTAWFLAKRPSLFRTSPGRAAGSVASLALWTTLAVRAATETGRASTYSVALAATACAGNVAMLGIHVRHGIANPRVFLGAGFAVIALADILRRR